MAESSWPDPANSRVVDDSQYEKLGLAYGPSGGVVGDFTNPQLVYGDSSGRQVKIAADRYALVRGHAWWSGGSVLTVAIGANVSGSTRTDLVVLRLSRTTWAVNVVVIAGTPGAGAPSPVQNTGTTGSWDLPLATVSVANNASTISAANVTYVASHLLPDGGGYIVPSVAALAYIPHPLPGMKAALAASLSDTTVYTYMSAGWRPQQTLYVRKLASETVSSGTTGTTLQNDDELFVSVAANATYEVRTLIRGAAQTADDLKVSFTGPAGYSFDYVAMGPTGGAAQFTDDLTGLFTTGGAPTFGGLGGTQIPIFINGILITGGTAGTFRFQFAQGNLSASGVTVLLNSYLRLDRVA